MKQIRKGDVSNSPVLGWWKCIKCGDIEEFEPEDVPWVTGFTQTKVYVAEKCPSCGNITEGWVRPSAEDYSHA